MIQLKRIGCRIWRIGFISGLAASPAQAAILTGYVTPIASDPAGSIREVHSADKDYRIDLNQLPAGTRNRLESLSGKRQTSTLDLPDSAIVSQSDVPMGIRPDCTELPIDYGQVTTLAKNPAIQDQNQFLASIPPGTLQTFTLLSKSKSAQAPGINKDTPGVIRMSADGKLILRYTCDRSSSVFNTVEVIRFNDTTKKFVFSEIDFGGRKANGGKAAVPVAKPANRVHEDGTKCMTCHNAKPSPPAPIDPRPNWENYDQWPGVFGNDEDRFRVNEPEGRQEYDNFNNFKKNKLENEKDPCYTSLPWPKNPTPTFQDYPYSVTYATGRTRDRQAKYELRPNLKFTEVLSHLNAQRLARRFSEDPRYAKARYLVMMEAMGCPVDGNLMDQKIQAAIPGYVPPNGVSTAFNPGIPYDSPDEEQKKNFAMELNRDAHFDPRTVQARGPRLYAVGQALGLQGMDWTQTFDRANDPYYNTGLTDGRSGMPDVQVPAVVQAELLKRMASSPADADLAAYAATTRGESSGFGQQFSCIDDLGGAATQVGNSSLCQLLQNKQDGLEKNPEPAPVLKSPLNSEVLETQPTGPTSPGAVNCPPPENPLLGPGNKGLVGQVGQIVGKLDPVKLDPKLVARGKKLISNDCSKCHRSNGSLGFFANEAKLGAWVLKNPGFVGEARRRMLSKDENLRMPADNKALDGKSVTAIEAYLQSLAPSAP